MGILSGLFGSSSASGSESGEDEGSLMTCDSCGSEVDESEVENGECEECYNSEYAGAKYCCGASTRKAKTPA